MGDYFPVLLDLMDKRCVVVGTGDVGRRKADALLRAGARVTFVGPDAEWPDDTVEVVCSRYSPDLLKGAFLVFAATDDAGLNRSIARDAAVEGALANCADDPAACDFILPANLRLGRLCISFSSGGTSPALARRMRDVVGRMFPPEYGAFADLLAEMRAKVMDRIAEREQRAELLRALAGQRFLGILCDDGVDAARAAMEEQIDRAVPR